jgi:hypothetical protein
MDRPGLLYTSTRIFGWLQRPHLEENHAY